VCASARRDQRTSGPATGVTLDTVEHLLRRWRGRRTTNLSLSHAAGHRTPPQRPARPRRLDSVRPGILRAQCTASGLGGNGHATLETRSVKAPLRLGDGDWGAPRRAGGGVVHGAVYSRLACRGGCVVVEISEAWHAHEISARGCVGVGAHRRRFGGRATPGVSRLGRVS
jgi:hypothetical protein